jgi:hypothetical protein
VLLGDLIEGQQTTFNSLSRDHRSRGRGEDQVGHPVPFNSLSRDHGGRSGADPEEGRVELSTPSLGITYFHEDEQLWHVDWSYLFQLPLSGSLEAARHYLMLALREPFNSLSRDHKLKS